MVDCLSNLDKCKASCCRVLCFDYPNLLQSKIHYLETHGCTIKRSADRKYKVLVPLKCPHLTDDCLCDLHNNKPLLCKGLDENNIKGYEITEGCILKP
ncbi:MAG: hypothetical protein Unbinned1693contig1002_9 [Prokaryotic dsDNA virus sp.]|jgi:Fe-S-cluster containining protein|nr:MAG: hypothetical protein Unbinned1693contig1002_9 [Prokaryotic dsDNA virus sp.]